MLRRVHLKILYLISFIKLVRTQNLFITKDPLLNVINIYVKNINYHILDQSSTTHIFLM